MPKLIDLTGQKYNRLTVISPNHSKHRTAWNCLCDCGTSVIVTSDKLRGNTTKSCGCYKKDIHTTHGMNDTPEYHTWENMIRRTTKTGKNYNNKNYIKNNITVCKRWKTFETFFEDMGHKPTPQHTIERIDNLLGYSPDNCKWATQKEQARNRSDNHNITFNGETKILSDWARDLNISTTALIKRLNRWSIEDALTKEQNSSHIKYTYKGNKYSLPQLAKLSPVSRRGFARRLERGMTIDEAINTPYIK